MKLAINKASGRYYARLKTGDPAKPYVKMTLGTKSAEDARKKAKAANLPQIEAALQAGRLSQEAVARLTVGKKFTTEQAAAQWIAAGANRDESPATTAKSQSVMAQWFAFNPSLPSLPPMSITEAHVSKFINRPDPEVGYSTRLRQLSVIRVFLRYCSEHGLVSGNVAGPTRMDVQHDKLSHEQLEPKRVEPFTEKEVRRILSNTEGWWRWAVGISWATSLRLGDICELEHACLSVPGHIIVHTSKRLRRVCLPITDRLTPGLAGILSEIPPTESRYLFPEQAQQYADVKAGRPKFSVYFGRELVKLGIENRSFHSLRHAAISRWTKEGFSLDQCQAYAGHSNSKTTKGYVHA